MGERVTVIGGGIIGLTSAWYLQQAGHRVTVVERGGRDRTGTSYGNAGMLVPSHFVPMAAPGVIAQGIRWMANPKSPFYIKPRLSPALASWGYRFWRASTRAHVERSGPLLLHLNRAGVAAYRELAEELPGDFLLREGGLFMLCNTEKGLEEEAALAEQANALGLPARVLSAAETQALEPDMPLDIVGSVLWTEDGHLDPGLFMRSLQDALIEGGTEFLFDTTVTGVRRAGDRIAAISTSVGELDSDTFVLAAGIWSESLARNLGLQLPMEAGKGYSMTLQGMEKNLRHPALLAEARAAITPMGTNLRVGGTMEMSGITEGVNPTRVEGIIDSALRYLPSLDRAALEASDVWHGFRPCSPDGLPYLGRSAGVSNLVVATGHSMMGVSLGPVSGRIVSQIVAGEEPETDITALSPDRYTRLRI